MPAGSGRHQWLRCSPISCGRRALVLPDLWRRRSGRNWRRRCWFRPLLSQYYEPACGTRRRVGTGHSPGLKTTSRRQAWRGRCQRRHGVHRRFHDGCVVYEPGRRLDDPVQFCTQPRGFIQRQCCHLYLYSTRPSQLRLAIGRRNGRFTKKQISLHTVNTVVNTVVKTFCLSLEVE